MHSLAFSVKRVDQSLLAAQRNLLRGLEITPARADMLFVISRLGVTDDRVLHQSVLWRALGVRRSTACRMLQALEEDGLVGRGCGFADRRQRRVWLTPKARALLLRIEQVAFRFKFALFVAFGNLPAVLSQLDGHLRTLRRRFDRATYKTYPWIAKMRWRFPRKNVPPRRKPS